MGSAFELSIISRVNVVIIANLYGSSFTPAAVTN
jgi:hypothetical protein